MPVMRTNFQTHHFTFFKVVKSPLRLAYSSKELTSLPSSAAKMALGAMAEARPKHRAAIMGFILFSFYFYFLWEISLGRSKLTLT